MGQRLSVARGRGDETNVGFKERPAEFVGGGSPITLTFM